jgi:propanol-preferring alcohol dehydrogenase
MQAMVLRKLGAALEWTDLADRQPGPGEIRVKVGACGVCRTDLHVVDGELPNPTLPIIPGHENRRSDRCGRAWYRGPTSA